MSTKRVLIVYAHQEPRSFNGALKDEAVRTLRENGYEVEVSDLYAMQFDPTASRRHFTGEKGDMAITVLDGYTRCFVQRDT
ncbi:hypothetical protein CHS0354_025097, partial [Potamilus streckersoni]